MICWNKCWTRALTDLRGEVSATHNHQYKEDLKQREVLLRKIIAAVHEAREVEPS